MNNVKDTIIPSVGKEEVPAIACKIVHDDCLRALASMDDNSVHMVLTDPPYFLDKMDDEWCDKSLRKSKAKAGVIGGLPVGMKFCKEQGKRLEVFMGDVSQQLYRVLCPGGFFVCFSQPRLSHRLTVGIEDVGFEIRDLFVWHYTKRAQAKAFSQEHFVDKMGISAKEKTALKARLDGRKTPQLRPQFEAMVLAQKPREGTFVGNWERWQVGLVDMKATLDGKIPSTVMAVEKAQGVAGHLTPKPLRLLAHLIKLFTMQGQVVLDPFLGSGSTALASLQTRRSCIGIEIEKKYVDLAHKRIEEMKKNERY